eukprot:UN01314
MLFKTSQPQNTQNFQCPFVQYICTLEVPPYPPKKHNTTTIKTRKRTSVVVL